MDRIERERFPLILTTPEVHRMLGGKVGINRLRRLAREQPRELGVKWHGRKALWDRDRVLAWWERQLRYAGGRLTA